MEKKLFLKFLNNSLVNSPQNNKNYDEGFGTYYERYRLYNLLDTFRTKYNINKIFEGPSDGITGVKGINSMNLVKSGANLTFYSPINNEIQYAKKFWKKTKFYSKVRFKIGDSLKIPYEDNYFDFVWNFCIIEHFSNPLDLIKEMSRISKKYVFIVIQNKYNYGTPFHILYHKIKGDEWDHGLLKFMHLPKLEYLFKKSGLKIIDKGFIDVPPWPDTWDMPIRGIFKKFMLLLNKKWSWEPTKIEENNLIKLCSFIEKSKLPYLMKLFFAHHSYILAIKQK